MILDISKFIVLVKNPKFQKFKTFLILDILVKNLNLKNSKWFLNFDTLGRILFRISNIQNISKFELLSEKLNDCFNIINLVQKLKYLKRF